jgi:hypothetical protein
MWKWGWEVKVRGKQKGIRKGGRKNEKDSEEKARQEEDEWLRIQSLIRNKVF